MPVSGSTRLAGVIGYPVRHSLSPALHNAAYAACGLDWVYVAMEVAPGEVPVALDGMRALGIAGLSVTTPHKDAAFAAVDDVSVAARALRAVNCVQLDDEDHLIGHNTDGDGFVDSLRHDALLDPVGLRVVVIGAGGAARSVVEALARANAAEVVVVNRTVSRAQDAAALAGSSGRVGTMADITAADLVVNATSIGMGSDQLPLDPALLRAGQAVADLVYHPMETALLKAVVARGARPVGGLGMLVHQAARQFHLWTALEAPVAAMRRAAEAELVRRANR